MKRIWNVGSLLVLFAGMIACNAQNAPEKKQDAPSVSASMSCEQLSGKKYNITISTGGKVDGTEILSFNNNLCESSECLKYGFPATAYQCSSSTDGAVSFNLVMLSDKEGRMDWKGTATSTKVTGTILWVKAGQADIAYTFEGPSL